jgi:adenylate kinase
LPSIPLIFLLGLPGSGKTTQAHLFGSQFHYKVISSGDIVRKAIANSLPYAPSLQRCLLGQLPPCRIITQLVSVEILESATRDPFLKGIVLDGFPRTVAQGRLLEQKLSSTQIRQVAAIWLDGLTREELIFRATNRSICRECGGVYQMRDGICPVCLPCGIQTIKRADGSREDVIKRMKAQRRYLQQLAVHFESKKMLFPLDARQPPDAIFALMSKLIHTSPVNR